MPDVAKGGKKRLREGQGVFLDGSVVDLERTAVTAAE